MDRVKRNKNKNKRISGAKYVECSKKKKSIRFLKLIRKKSDVICKPYGLKTDFMESGPLEMPVLFKLLIPTLEGGFRA